MGKTGCHRHYWQIPVNKHSTGASLDIPSAHKETEYVKKCTNEAMSEIDEASARLSGREIMQRLEVAAAFQKVRVNECSKTKTNKSNGQQLPTQTHTSGMELQYARYSNMRWESP